MRRSILATLAYYDSLNFPLKKEEIFDYLFVFDHLGVGRDRQPEYSEFEKILEQLLGEDIINEIDGYFYLFGKEYLIPLRIKKEKISRKKLSRTIRYIQSLKYIPFVSAVFASGSLALANTNELSDLDLLIVTNKNKIWLTRLMVSFILSGKRRGAYDGITPDKLCLNHFIVDDPPYIPFKSIYTAQSYINLIPLYIKDKRLIDNFFETNSWLGGYVSRPHITNWQRRYENVWVKSDNSFINLISRIGEIIIELFGNWPESRAKKLQLGRIIRNPQTHKPGSRVVYKDEQIAFHLDSVETAIIAKYNKNIENLGFPANFAEKDSGLTRTP